MLNKINPTIAVIDSGIGGVSILKQLITKNKCGNYIYFADNLYMPYGNKSKQWVKKRVDEIITTLQHIYKVDYIIIACNTASCSIDSDNYKNLSIMKFKKELTYFATELTKNNLNNINVISDKNLAKEIEKNIFNEKAIEQTIKRHIQAHKLQKITKIVLGCTHYELVNDIFKKYCPNSIIINNSSFIINELEFKYDINQLNIKILLSKNSNSYANKILNLIRK